MTCPNRSFDASPASDLFFPQRIELGIDGDRYSPAVIERITATGGASTSFRIAAKVIELLMDLKVAPRTVNNKTKNIGLELKASRDKRTDAHCRRPITAERNVAQPAVALAAVQVDGGRMQTRTAGRGPGVHDPHWRENKNAGFYRMRGDCFDDDPHPELPSCFSSKKQMQSLLSGLPESEAVDNEKPDLSWRPESLVRTCVASMGDSERFGELMSAEAEQRGFYSAERRAFLGDGLKYNWSIQQKHFDSFTPILDFIHPIERLHETAKVLYRDDVQAGWEACLKWIELCWQGDVEEVIGQLEAEQLELEPPSEDTAEDDPRVKLAETIGYLRGNVSRMDYPSYRRGGLPTSSCLIESQVKEMNHRIKGSEKFWDDGDGGEAINHVRAALISDGDQLHDHISSRPGTPYTRPARKNRQPALT
ncbi:MAG: hypothetical protein AAGD07_20655 [Planctomycetota bacterium]